MTRNVITKLHGKRIRAQDMTPPHQEALCNAYHKYYVDEFTPEGSDKPNEAWAAEDWQLIKWHDESAELDADGVADLAYVLKMMRVEELKFEAVKH